MRRGKHRHHPRRRRRHSSGHRKPYRKKYHRRRKVIKRRRKRRLGSRRRRRHSSGNRRRIRRRHNRRRKVIKRGGRRRRLRRRRRHSSGNRRRIRRKRHRGKKVIKRRRRRRKLRRRRRHSSGNRRRFKRKHRRRRKDTTKRRKHTHHPRRRRRHISGHRKPYKKKRSPSPGTMQRRAPAKRGYEIAVRQDGFYTITDNKEPLPTFIVGDSVQLAKFVPVTIPVKTVEEAIKWLVDRRIYCIIITRDGEFLWPAGEVPTEKDLKPLKPQHGERDVEVILLTVLSKYSPSGPDAPKAPRVTTVKPVPDKPMVVPSCFRVTLDRNREPIINYRGRPLRRVTIQWDVTKYKIAFARMPVETMDAAIKYALYHRVTFFIFAGPKHFYCPIDATTTEGDLTPLSPGSKAVQARMFNVKPLVEHAERWTVTYSNVYPQIVYVDDAGNTVPMETYFMKGDQPKGATWREVTPTAATGRPELSCIDLCTKLAFSWSAFRLKPRPICWCGNNVDVTGLSPSVPSEPNYIQIISTGQLMEPLIVLILTDNKPTARFEIKQEPNNYVKPFFKEPVSAPKRKLPRAFVKEQPSGIEWYKVLGQDYIGCGPLCYAASFEYSSQQMVPGGGFGCRCGKTPAKSRPPQLPLKENAPEDAGLIEVIVLPPQPAKTYKPSEIVSQTTFFTPRHLSVAINGKPLTPRFLNPAKLKNVPGAYTPPNDPKKREDCLTSCQSMGFNVVAVSKDYCICLPDGKVPLPDDEEAGISVYDLTPFMPKAAPGKGVTYGIYNMPNKYLRVLVNHVPVKIGFSRSKPDAVWKDQGQKDGKACLETCHSKMMSFMMIKTEQGRTECWCGATVDMTGLENTFPDSEGYYEVIDISPMHIGSEFTITKANGLKVTSKKIDHGYFSFDVILPGDTKSSPLTLYFTRTKPTSLRLFMIKKKEPAECVATCTELGYDYAMLPYNGKPCQCGTLVPGQQLRLPGKAPDTGGFFEVVQLRSLPTPAPSKSGENTFKFVEMVFDYCFFIIDGVRAKFGFSRSKPNADWKDQGQKSPEVCFDTCHSKMMSFMMVKTEQGRTNCWCGATVDMKSLEDTFPDSEGYYEVIDIGRMHKGSEFTVTHPNGLKVTSKSSNHGYFSFDAILPGETKSSPLVTYYAQSEPTSLRLYMIKEKEPAGCVASCTEIGYDFAVLPSNGKSCRCGALVSGQQLNLPDKAPDTSGFFEIVRLRSLPVSEKPGGGSYKYIGLSLNYCLFIIDGVRARFGFSRSKPGTVWKDQGQKSPEMCFDTCHSKMMSFMMIKTEQGRTECWCGATVDMKSLEDTFPDSEGYYEVIDISAMYIGSEFTFTQSTGLKVTSKRIPNGYYSLVVILPGETKSSPLVVYYAQSKPTSLRLYTTKEKEPAQCVATCMEAGYDYAVLPYNGKPCQCGTLVPGQQLRLPDKAPDTGGFFEVVQLRSLPAPAPSKSGEHSYKSIEMAFGYRLMIINGARAQFGFSRSKPDTVWKDQGQKDYGTCFDTCFSKMMSFMMVKTEQGRTNCWCAATVNMKSLEDTFPDSEGYYEIIDISQMYIGSEFTVTDSSGLEVTSKKIDNGYFSLVYKMPGGTGTSSLTTYFTQSRPDGILWYPCSKTNAADCTLSCLKMKFQLAMMSTAGGTISCQCGTLDPGQQLQLSDTSVPKTSGFIEVVQLPSIPEPNRHSSGHTYIKCYWSTKECYIAFINGKKIVTKFAPKESVMSVGGLTLDLAGTGKSCLSECVRLSFPKMACSKSYCRCLDGLQGLQTRQQHVPNANLLSVIDLTTAMPKPDDSRSMAFEMIPVTNYGRFMYSNTLMKAYFTQHKVDISTGPPGDWTLAGNSVDFAGAVSACAGKNKNFVALVPNGHQFMCWCAKSVDLGALTTTIPTDTGYAQILDATKIISDMTTQSRNFVHEEGRR